MPYSTTLPSVHFGPIVGSRVTGFEAQLNKRRVPGLRGRAEREKGYGLLSAFSLRSAVTFFRDSRLTAYESGRNRERGGGCDSHCLHLFGLYRPSSLMIISDRYKYLFIQNEGTGSSSLGEELKGFYDGRDVLWKHAQLSDFEKTATPEQKKYFVIAGVRNPLDRMVTIYLRMKIESFQKLENDIRQAQAAGASFKADNLTKQIEKRRFIQERKLTFSEYFNLFLKGGEWREHKKLCLEQADYVCRHENLQEDFARLLEKLGIDQIRPVPNLNPTPEKKNDFLSYYPPEIWKDVIRYTHRSMSVLGYAYPSAWIERMPFLVRKMYHLDPRPQDGLCLSMA